MSLKWIQDFENVRKPTLFSEFRLYSQNSDVDVALYPLPFNFDS